MRILPHIPPKLNRPQFKCDEILSEKLVDKPILKHLNKSFVCAFIGRAGSGKSTMMISFVQSRGVYRKVFDQIFVFMPSSSRDSLKDNIFNVLPRKQLHEGITFESLQEVYNQLLENTEDKKRTLIIFDDVQSYMKDPEISTALLHIIANRRHLRCSIMMCIQNYVKMPLDVRKSITHLFIFNVSKEEKQKIYEELVEIGKDDWALINKMYRQIRKTEPNSFIFIHGDIIYINWNEVLIDESDSD